MAERHVMATLTMQFIVFKNGETSLLNRNIFVYYDLTARSNFSNIRHSSPIDRRMHLISSERTRETPVFSKSDPPYTDWKPGDLNYTVLCPVSGR